MQHGVERSGRTEEIECLQDSELAIQGPSFLQNTGIPLAILGFSLRSTELVVVAGLLISTGVLLTTEKSICLHPALEATLLRLAIAALASVGLFYSLF